MATKNICIGREFGSGGSEIAAALGNALGLKVYDKELLHLACMNSGVTEEKLKNSDERATNLLLYETVHEGYDYTCWGLPTSEVLFRLQSREIRRLAAKESCIFVGRCADFTLKDSDVSVLSVFVRGPTEQRIQRIMERKKLSHLRAKQTVRSMDLQRKKYYEHYTGKTWGKADNYDLSIDSGITAIDEAVRIISARYEEL